MQRSFSRVRLVRSFVVALSTATFVVSSLAVAGEGVVEINQVCAQGSGCFSGDGAGFPVTITGGAGRSYRLTSDLVVSSADTTAVLVTGDDVSLDLGGFSIRGSNVCSVPPVTCAATGTGSGVEILGERAEIFHGSVTGMGAAGIFGNDPALLGLSSNGHVVRDLRVSHNGAEGIRLDGSFVTVRHCTTLQNGSHGIAVFGAGGTVMDSIAGFNAAVGINVNAGDVISGNSSTANGGIGILTLTSGMVERNMVRANTGRGIQMGSSSSYRANLINSNAGGTVSGGINVGGNVCNGVVCP